MMFMLLRVWLEFTPPSLYVYIFLVFCNIIVKYYFRLIFGSLLSGGRVFLLNFGLGAS